MSIDSRLKVVDNVYLRLYVIIRSKMEDSERQALILELNKLSEFEEQNLERMKEIAHVLVADYMHKDGRTTKQANRERMETF